MAETQYSYGTSILTTKSPQQAAQILSGSVEGTQEVVEKRLLRWFGEYSKEIQRNNEVLQGLLREGSQLFSPQYSEEYGGFHKVWNCVLNSVQTEIHNNEAMVRNLKLESVGPLRDLSQKDVRFSELLVNAQELRELSGNFGRHGSDSEIQWNMKAPQIFQNFENYKKYEFQLLFDVCMSYLNSLNNKYTKGLSSNENSVNYILSDYRIDAEMEGYLDYLVNKKKLSAPSAVAQQAPQRGVSHRPSTSDSQSIQSNNTRLSLGAKLKRHSKIKSKVGSIFGRKNKSKAAAASPSLTIPEAASFSSSNTNTRTNASNDSLANAIRQNDLYHGPGNRGPTSGSREQLAYKESSHQPRQNTQHLSRAATSESELGQRHPQAQQPQQPQQPQHHQHPKQAITSQEGPASYPPPDKYLETTPLKPKVATPQNQNNNNSPNVLKYGSESSDDEPDGTNTKGRRLSLLQRHDLDVLHPFAASVEKEGTPKVITPDTDELLSRPSTTDHKETEKAGLSSQSSTGKYSFEAGDEKHPLSTPKDSRENSAAFTSEPQNEQTQSRRLDPRYVSTSGSSGFERVPLEQESQAFPPRPPSRKVVTHELSNNQVNSHSKSVPPVPGSFVNRKDVHSQLFQNLPATRNSIIQQPIMSQNTGNSLLKNNDLFKHFDSNYIEVPGLNASVAEIINVNFKNDNIVKSQALGEIAFNYKAQEKEDVSPFLIHIPNNFDKVILNNTFVSKVGNDDFKIDPSAIMAKTLGGLKYLRSIGPENVPILIRQIWKFEDHQSSLMVSLQLNPLYASELTLQNLVVSVSLASCETTSASSRPQGSFNKEKNRITWRFNNEVTFSQNNPEEKLIARFMTNGKGSEHESGIQIKFSVSNPPKSILVYDQNDNEVHTDNNLISGSYSGHTV